MEVAQNILHSFDPNKILVENRQRKEIKDIDILADSIKRNGQINPITVTRDLKLVTGERRLRAAQLLGIPVLGRYHDELTRHQQREIELEENIKRADLTWQEQTQAIFDYHQSRLEDDPTWTIQKTADSIGLTAGAVSVHITVAREFAINPAFKESSGLRAAYNIIQRRQQREIDGELSQFFEAEREPAPTASHPPVGSNGNQPGANGLTPVDGGHAKGDIQSPRPSGFSASDRTQVVWANAIEWMDAYRERPFNFLHCDFPYGISMDSNELQGTRDDLVRYDDSPDLYWALCSALARNIDRLLQASAHVMFWYSMNYHSQTIDFFRRNTNLVVNDFPLIWHKSDLKGILPDPKRGGRRTYETALMMTRGDRPIVKPVSISISEPTNKAEALHLSEKPMPVLRHFFQMFVDDLSEVLDPTCGAGSALCAAESFGAQRIVGVEIKEEFVDTSKGRIAKMRAADKLLENL